MAGFKTIDFEGPEGVCVVNEAKFEDGDFGCALTLNITDEVGVDHKLYYSCGKNWESRDGGRRAVKVDSNGNEVAAEHQSFHARSWAGVLVKAMEGMKITKQLIKAGRDDEAKAATWEGLKFSFEPLELNFGDMGKKTRPVPVKFHGFVESSKASAPSAAPAAAPAAEAAPQPAAAPAPGGDPRIKGIAMASADLQAFRANLMSQAPDLANDGTLMGKLWGGEAESWFASLKG